MNPHIVTDSYPLPSSDEIFAKIEGPKYKSKIDVSHAYLHFKLVEEEQKLLVIKTHRGLFKCLCLPFGNNMAVEISTRNKTITT